MLQLESLVDSDKQYKLEANSTSFSSLIDEAARVSLTKRQTVTVIMIAISAPIKLIE